jgi:AraC-like DNA-binding protein/methyl-accepting chemotaxis protein
LKQQIHEEIILYNQLNVDNTVHNYESQLYIIKNSAMNLYWEENIKNLHAMSVRGEPLDYYLASTIGKQLRSNLLTSSFKYVDNLFIVFQQAPIIIESEGVYTNEKEKEKFLISSDYGGAFLNKQVELDTAFNILPAANFTGYAVKQAGGKNLIPIIIKNQFYYNMNIVVMVDADKMYSDLHQSINNDLLIMDASNKIIFTANMNPEEEALQTLRDNKVVIKNDNYYFNGQGDSGLMYINIIPTKNIAAKMTRLNNIFLLTLLVAIMISVFISVLFSRQLNDPIKSIINSLKQMKMPGGFTSRIKEFNVISDNLKDLHKKNSVLRYYAYSNQLKDIHSNFGRIQELMDTGRPFILMVVEVAFKKTFSEKLNMDLGQAINGIREYINSCFSDLYPGSLTFQIEKQQIVSILFMDGEQPNLKAQLLEIKKVFDLDNEYYFLTLAFTRLRKHPNELSQAYEETLSMLSQRHLNDETQIIDALEVRKPGNMLTASQEMEFHNYLMAGNEKDLQQWVERQQNSLERKQRNFAIDYKRFSSQVTAKVDQTLLSLQIDTGRLQVFGSQLSYCCTRADYDLYFSYYLTTAAEMVRQHKDQRDPITTFVFEYLENNYKRDVSLEAAADHLKITSGYLSTYFKEKTGWNYSDYLNNLRIDKAKHILKHSDLKIKAVAEQVGYQNVNSFIRMFKKITGLTPGDFRKNEIEGTIK